MVKNTTYIQSTTTLFDGNRVLLFSEKHLVLATPAWLRKTCCWHLSCSGTSNTAWRGITKFKQRDSERLGKMRVFCADGFVLRAGSLMVLTAHDTPFDTHDTPVVTHNRLVDTNVYNFKRRWPFKPRNNKNKKRYFIFERNTRQERPYLVSFFPSWHCDTTEMLKRCLLVYEIIGRRQNKCVASNCSIWRDRAEIKTDGTKK